MLLAHGHDCGRRLESNDMQEGSAAGHDAADDQALLDLTIAKAEKLLATLEAQSVDLDRQPRPNLTEEQLAQGRSASAGAMNSARNLLASLLVAKAAEAKQFHGGCENRSEEP